MKSFLPAKNAWRVAAMIALATAAATASAQSNEYRRGYDQGYRDGFAAAQAEQGSGQRHGGERINIVSARYGNRDGVCDARQAVRQIAGRRRHVEFRVGNDLCGDPSPGREKRLSVIYTCGGGPELRADARENSVISLYCR
jgi:hypothetical protein